MQHYRVYFIGQGDHFIKSIDLSCADDSAAIESAKQLIDGHDLELWQRDRRVARFDSSGGTTAADPPPSACNSGL